MTHSKREKHEDKREDKTENIFKIMDETQRDRAMWVSEEKSREQASERTDCSSSDVLAMSLWLILSKTVRFQGREGCL
jgi:hypothetical protein